MSERTKLLFVTVCILAIHVGLVLFVLPKHVFYLGDSSAKFFQAWSLVQNRFRSTALVYPGRAIDPTFTYAPNMKTAFIRSGGERKPYGVYSDVFAAIAGMGFALAGFAGLYVPSFIGTMLICVSSFWVARQVVSAGVALWAPAILCLGSPLLFFGVEFHEHQLATGLGFGAIALGVAHALSGRASQAVLSGVLTGACAMLRAEGYVLGLALAASHFLAGRGWRGTARACAFLALGALGVLVPLWCLNQMAYGAPLGLHVAKVDRAVTAWQAVPLAERAATWPLAYMGSRLWPWLNAVESTLAPVFTYKLQLTLLAAPPLALLCSRLSRLNQTARDAVVSLSITVMSLLMLAYAFGNLRRYQAGLLHMFPLALFGYFGLLVHPPADASPSSRTALRYLAWTMIGYFAVAMVLLHRGVGVTNTWGPRYYFVTFLPLVALLLWVASRVPSCLSPMARNMALACLAGLLLASLAVQGGGIYALGRAKGRYARLDRLVESAQRQFVITDFPGLSELVPRQFCKRTLLCIREGVTEFAPLIALASSHDAKGFCVVDHRPRQSQTDAVQAPEVSGYEKTLLGTAALFSDVSLDVFRYVAVPASL